MAVALNALVLKIGADTSGVSKAVRAVRSDVRNVNSVMRTAATAADRFRNASASLERVHKTGALSTKEYRRALATIEQQFRSAERSSGQHSAAITRAQTVVKSSVTEQQKLIRSFQDLKTALRQGAITQQEYAQGLDGVKARLRELKSLSIEQEQQRQAEATKRLNHQHREALALVRREVPETTRLAQQIRQLRAAQQAGVITEQQRIRAANDLRNKLAVLRRETDQSGSAAGRARERIRRMTSEMRSQKTEASGLADRVRNLVIAYGGFRLISFGGGIAVGMEQSQVQFEVFTGSAKVAMRLMEDLKKLDRDAPSFGLEDLQRSTKALLAYGVGHESAIEKVTQLTAISGGNKEALQSLSLAYAQVAAKGKLMGEEVRQFVNAGFNPLQQISADTGKSMGELSDEMRNGNISLAMVERAMQNATSAGGRFFGMNEKIAATSGGSFSRLRNSVSMAAADIANYFLPAAQKVATALSQTIEWLRATAGGFGDVSRRTIAVTAGITTALIVVPRLIQVIRGVIAVVNMWRNSQIALLAFTGPKGWATIAAGAAVAAGTIYMVDQAFQSHNETLAKTAEQAGKTQAAISQVGTNAETDPMAGRSTQVAQMIDQYRERNKELVWGVRLAEQQKAIESGASSIQLAELQRLQKRNAMLQRTADLEKKIKNDRLEALRNRSNDLDSERKNLESLAKQTYEQFRTPFQSLTDELVKLNRLRIEGRISEGIFDRAKQAALDNFRKAGESSKSEAPPSARRGSREEYAIIRDMQNRTVQETIRQHREAMQERIAQRIAAERAAKAAEDHIAATRDVETAIREIDTGDSV